MQENTEMEHFQNVHNTTAQHMVTISGYFLVHQTRVKMMLTVDYFMFILAVCGDGKVYYFLFS